MQFIIYLEMSNSCTEFLIAQGYKMFMCPIWEYVRKRDI